MARLGILRCILRTEEAVGARAGGGGRGCTHVVHAGSRMTIDPRIPYNDGTEHIGFSTTGQTLLAPSAKRRAVFGESHEG